MTKEEQDELIEKVRNEVVRDLERQLDSARNANTELREKVQNLTARNEELRFALSCLRTPE